MKSELSSSTGLLGEGFAFQRWYLLKYGGHVSELGCFAPISAMYEWHIGDR